MEPRGPVAPPLLVHTEGVPEGLPAALQAAGDRGRARRTPGFTRGWAPAALQAVRDRPSSCATHLFGARDREVAWSVGCREPDTQRIGIGSQPKLSSRSPSA